VIFHAKDIWHGAKRFSREKYNRNVRQQILTELCRIPRIQGIPVFLGIVDNTKYAENNPDKTPKERAIEGHCLAYSNCVCLVDSFMKEHCHEDELVTLVLENNNQAKSAIRKVQDYLADPGLIDFLGNHEMVRFLAISKVVDVPHFVEKADSPIMQIADACAFVFSRHLAGKSDVDDLAAEIRPQLILPFPEGGVGLG